MEFNGVALNRKIPNLTPLIDMVFLLLVFFMLTAHFVNDQSLDIVLPEASSSLNLEDQDVLEIVINNNGNILLGEKNIKPNDLDEALRKALQGRTNKQVILRGDKSSKLDLTVQVMDAARKAGADSLDIITEQP